jgi:CheY-like chemotaxis protein
MNQPTLKRILYVEDEPDIQTVAKLALEAIGGFVVEACSSGHEALRRAEAFRPDLILLDVMMPGLDGPATLRELRGLEALARTPVVFMTARVQPREVADYRAMGAADVIAKPFDPMILPEKVRESWRRALDGGGT